MTKPFDIYQFQSPAIEGCISVAWSSDASGANLPSSLSQADGLFKREMSWEFVRQLSPSECEALVAKEQNLRIFNQFGYLIEDRAIAQR